MERELYKECMRNHAANLGTYSTDGCGEYTSDPTSPGALRCAACGCHRNFHRKVPTTAGGIDAIALGGGSTVIMGYSPTSSLEDRAPNGKKRTRTKFTVEQKDEMLRFAEKIGWKMPRKEEGCEEMTRFCKEIGVGRQTFKVWMHNHKNNSFASTSISEADQDPNAINSTGTITASVPP